MQRIGIISEGVADQAVLANIIKAFQKQYETDFYIDYIRPEDEEDETQKASRAANPDTFGSWTLVKSDCEVGIKIDGFFKPLPISAIDTSAPAVENASEYALLIIGIDADRCQDYGVENPPALAELSDKSIVSSFRGRIIAQIQAWLGACRADRNNPREAIIYAINIQAVEAWLLTIHDKSIAETSTRNNSASDLHRIISKRLNAREQNQLRMAGEKAKMNKLSEEFKKMKSLLDCATRNQSLKDFCEDLEAAFQQAGS